MLVSLLVYSLSNKMREREINYLGWWQLYLFLFISGFATFMKNNFKGEIMNKLLNQFEYLKETGFMKHNIFYIEAMLPSQFQSINGSKYLSS